MMKGFDVAVVGMVIYNLIPQKEDEGVMKRTTNNHCATVPASLEIEPNMK